MRLFRNECKKIRRELSPFLDRELDIREERKVSLHLKHCVACRDCLEEFSLIKDVAGSLERVTPPEHIFSKVIEEVSLSRRKEEKASYRWQLIPVFASAVAIAVVAVYFSAIHMREEGRFTRRLLPAVASTGPVKHARPQPALPRSLKRRVRAFSPSEEIERDREREEILSALRQRFAIELAQKMRERIVLLDEAMVACEQALEENPYNENVLQACASTYEKSEETRTILASSGD